VINSHKNEPKSEEYKFW